MKLPSRYVMSSAVVALVAATAISGAWAAGDTLKSALDASTVKVNLRYRLESVDQEGFADNALASTLRSRVTLESGKLAGFSGALELDNVTALGNDSYNSTANGRTGYPVVADPEGTDLNQALLQYQAGTTQLVAGRQRINQLNQRFLGSVGWRQNEQTLDGYRWLQALPHQVSVDLSHFTNVNRVFGPEGAKADEGGRFDAALVDWRPSAAQTLSAFYYDLGFDNSALLSSRTLGVDYTGVFLAEGSRKLQVHLALAQQEDNSNSLTHFSNDYGRLDATYQLAALSLELGHERLGSDGYISFQTPLATLHAFNGFADMFLTTPVNGLQDSWLGLGYEFSQLSLGTRWHKFQSDKNSLDYGSEWDLTLGHKFSGALSAQLKLASYTADSFAVDTNKLWLSLNFAL